MDEALHHHNPNPVSTANPISKLFFWWLNPLFKKGYVRKLEVDDMFNCCHEDQSDVLGNKLEKEWGKEVERAKTANRAPSLVRALFHLFGVEYLLLGIVLFLEEATKVCQPLLLGGLIRYFTPNSTTTKTEGYLYAMGVSLCAIMLAVSHHQYFFGVQRIGMKMRIACCSLLYRKGFDLNCLTRGSRNIRFYADVRTLFMMHPRTDRFGMPWLFKALICLHYLWIGPLEALAVLAVIWRELGPSTLTGFGVLLLLLPIQGWMGKLFSKFRQKIAKLTDERVKVMNEIISGMRVIKMYCWEKPFGDLVAKIRNQETSVQKRLLYIQSAWETLTLQGRHICLLGILLFFILVEHQHMRASSLFVAMAALDHLGLSLLRFTMKGVRDSIFLHVSISRMEKYLTLDELKVDLQLKDDIRPDEFRIGIQNVTAKWDESLEQSTLYKVSAMVTPEELLAVIGPVGAGKSSLLMAVLRELPLLEGSLRVKGRIAYVSQQPWVFSASLRQNITFGNKFVKVKYDRIMEACALNKDVAVMPHGDMTLIGDRGVSLSGGQRARVSLARALYMEADVYLLDDPLSAVDAAVGRHIFRSSVIQGVLKDKPRILVTHQLQYLKSANQILILKEGEMIGSGTFDQLATSGVDFSSLLKRDDEKEEERKSHDPLQSKSHDPLYFKSNDPLNCNSRHSKSVTRLRSRMNSFNSRTDESKQGSTMSLTSTESDCEREMDGTCKCDQLSTSAVDFSAPLKREDEKEAEKKSKDPLHAKPVMRLGPRVEYSCTDASQEGSMVSFTSVGSVCEAETVQVPEEEERREGTVGVSVYYQYFKAGAGILKFILLTVLCLSAQAAYIMSDWWLSYWSNQEEARFAMMDLDNQLRDAGNNVTNVTIPDVDSHLNVGIFSASIGSVFLFGLLRALMFFKVAVDASKHLHNNMFASILRSPIRFFDTNPVGRVLNRFSKDVGHMDDMLPITFFDFIQCFLLIVGIVLVAGAVNPWVFIPVVPLCIMFAFIRRYYIRTSRHIKRLEGTTCSPVFSHLSATLQGLQTIRAFGAQEKFTEEFDNHQNLHTEAWFLFLSTSRWLAIRLDWLCAMFVTAVSFCCILAADSLNAGLVGLSVTYAIRMTALFQWGVRQSAEVENQMISVERVLDYSSLPSEAPLTVEEKKQPPPDWPQQGVISAEKASLRYFEDLPLVLKDLDFYIRAKEKVGIVGRTGAGKSSLVAMLLRLVEPIGKIMIDGINVQNIGLHDLRKQISIIPQDPVLFTGTLRRNLDPFGDHEDSSLWNALGEVQLKAAIQDLPDELDSKVTEGGQNFSVGQRQLICLARAILRRNKILVIDEATANVDQRTDALIQQTIREKFANCTVLTIAHRLNTIMDSDRLLVMEDGCIVEFDTPHALLQKQQSLLYKLVQQTGKTEMEHLMKIARNADAKRLPGAVGAGKQSQHATADVPSTGSASDKLTVNGSLPASPDVDVVEQDRNQSAIEEAVDEETSSSDVVSHDKEEADQNS